MGENELKITYELLFEVLRREKERKELQKIDSNFYHDFYAYLKDKKEALSKLSSISEREAEQIRHQISNAQNILKRIYDCREKKIIDKAIIKAMTKSEIIDTTNMLEEEKEFFNKLVSLLMENRELIFKIAFSGQSFEKKELKEEKEEAKAESPDKQVIVRFLASIPKFVGLDGRIYGPFSEEEITTLPKSIANVLLEKERVELINAEDNKKSAAEKTENNEYEN
ncbi:MAG: hypothetical protein ACP5H9_02680 [Candidatus Woesearchaeota archaeon]